MVLLKLKKGAFIKKIIKKLALSNPKSQVISAKEVFKRFILHVLCLIIFSVLFIPISKIDGLNPITHTFKDLAFSDIYFSKIRKGTTADTASNSIYIVNVGRKDKNITRQEIANFISVINNSEFKPKVIGIDVLFESYSDSSTDNQLSKALQQENIVTIKSIEKIKKNVYTSVSSLKKFTSTNYGFSNQWIERDRPLTERYFKPIFKINESEHIDHFSLKIASLYNNKKYKEFSTKKMNEPYLINYRGNYSIKNHIDINDTSQFKKLKDKIVLMGLFEFNENNQPLYNEDLHWSPTNKRYFGRSAQDMYGIEIQAQIIANIINSDFIRHSKSLNLIVQIILSLFIYFLLLRFYIKSKIRFTLSKLFLQVFTVGALILLSLFQIMWFNIYMDYTLLVIAAFLSAEIVGLLEGIIDKYYPKLTDFFSKENKPIEDEIKSN